MDTIENDIEDKNPQRPSFPVPESQDLLLINSPKLHPEKPFSKPVKKPNNIDNIKIFPVNNLKLAKAPHITLENPTNKERKNSLSIIPRLLLSPFIRIDRKAKENAQEKTLIIQKSAQLRTNLGLKDYYQDKMQEKDQDSIIRHNLQKITRKMSKQYSKIINKSSSKPKFAKLSELTIGIMKIKDFLRRRKTKKYIELFSSFLENNEEISRTNMDFVDFTEIEILHNRLIKRNPHSDPFFISIIEKYTFNSIIREYKGSLKRKMDFLMFFYQAFRYLTQKFLKSKYYKLFTVMIIVANSICLYQEFELLEATLPKEECLNLTQFPPIIHGNYYHDFNILALYYFIIEFLLKITGFGLKSYIKDPWNVFDFAILCINFQFMNFENSAYFQPSPFRLFRFIHLLKIKALQSMVQSLYKSLLLLTETFFIFVFLLSLYAIAGTQMFSGLLKNRCFDPLTGIASDSICGICDSGYLCWKGMQNPEFGAMNFDEFPMSFIQTLRIMTLSLWSLVMYNMQSSYSIYCWIYFFTLIIVGNFFLLNLTLAVLKVKFSDNLAKQQENAKGKEVKKYSFKALLQRKVIQSSREVAFKTKNLNRRESRKFWIFQGRFAMPFKAPFEENPQEIPKKMEEKIRKTWSFRYFINISFDFLSEIRNFLKENEESQALKRSRLEIVINHSQEYQSLSIHDIFHDREQGKLEWELQKHQELLKTARFSRDFQREKSRLEILRKKAEKNTKNPNSNDLNLLKSNKEPFLKSPLNFNMKNRDSIFSNNSKRNSISKATKSIFSPIHRKMNENNLMLMNIDMKSTMKSSKSPLKKTPKELKLLMERKILRNKQELDLSLNYNALKKLINEPLDYIAKNEAFVSNNTTNNTYNNSNNIANGSNNFNNYEDSNNNLEIYVKILEKDLLLQKITNNHWSGYNVIQSKSRDFIYWAALFSNFENANIEIWLKGFLGKIKTFLKLLEIIMKSRLFANLTFIFILISLVELSLEGSIDQDDSSLLLSIITHFFLFEFVVKILSLKPKIYINSLLNRIDLIILIYSLALVYFNNEINNIEISEFKSLRFFKIILIFRVFRLLSHIEYMKFILQVLTTTFDYFIYLAFLLVLLIVVFALIFKQIYSQGCDFSILLSQEKTFQSFLSTIITIFNLISLDTWNTLLTATFMENIEIPMIFISLFLIFFGNFVILNLFIAIMLDSFEKVKRKVELQNEEKEEELKKTNKQRYLELKEKAKEIKNEASSSSSDDGLSDSINEISNQSPLQKSPEFYKSTTDTDYFHDIYCDNSLYLFSKSNNFRKFTYRTVNSPSFDYLIYFLIISVGIILALDTFFEKPSTTIIIMNLMINFGFILEFFFKVVNAGLFLDKGSYLRDYKNLLDISTIILAFLGIFAPQTDALRGLLLIRLWRPFSIIYKRKYIKDLLSALLGSLSQIANVFLVVFIVWLAFSLIGILLFQDRFGYCGERSNFSVNKAQCDENNEEWIIFFLNFDDIFQALISIFALSTLDNWSNLLNLAVNSDIMERGPSRNNNQYSSYAFFISFVFIAVWLFFNLFIGVIFTNFIEISRKNLHPFLNGIQVKWLEIQNYILTVDSYVFKRPDKGFSAFLYEFLISKIFAMILDLVLLMNFVALCFNGEAYEDSLWLRAMLFFISMFLIFEAIIKIFVYKKDYFRMTKWNTFNLLASLGYLLDLFISEGLIFDYNGSPFLNKLYRLLKVLKVISLIRIIEKLTGLKALILNLLLSMRLILNMILLMFIVIFIYSVIGVYMFKNVNEGETINEFNNFKNLFYALMALFKCVTREQWADLMFDLNKVPPHCEEGMNCGSIFAPLYFISFMIINTYIIFNLFILILLQQFEEFHKNTVNPMITFKQHIKPFKEVWNRYCINEEGKLHINKIVGFLKELGSPLGFFLINIKNF